MKTIKIANYERYEVSDTGLVISNALTRPRVLKPQKVSQSKKKYLQVRLYNEENKRDNKGKKIGKLFYVHRLVWEAFVGEIPEDKEIDHIDDNPHNNNLNNLRLIGRTQNVLKHYNKKTITYLRPHRKEVIRDYIKLGSYDLVADKWGVGFSTIFRTIKNVTTSPKDKKYVTRAFNPEYNDLFAQTKLTNKTKEQLEDLWEKNYGVKYS